MVGLNNRVVGPTAVGKSDAAGALMDNLHESGQKASVCFHLSCIVMWVLPLLMDRLASSVQIQSKYTKADENGPCLNPWLVG